METDELISTLGVGYIDEMLQEYEHDCQWLQQIKADLGQQSRNMLNKANATLRCAMNDLKMLQETILKEHQTNNNPKKEHMKQYTGTKTVKAEPMTYGEAYKRGLIRENAYVEEYSDNKGYHVVYPDNYESWSPAEVFEDAYKVSETPLDRLNIELSDLNLKRKKLRNFIYFQNDGKDFQALPLGTRAFLVAQLDTKEAYFNLAALRQSCMEGNEECRPSGLSFEQILPMLREGFSIRRSRWNGKSLMVFKQVPAHITSEKIPNMQSLPEEAKRHILAAGDHIDYVAQ